MDTLSTSFRLDDAKFGSFSSIFFVKSLASLGNMARELGGSPFRCNTDWKPVISSCVTFSFHAVSIDSPPKDEELVQNLHAGHLSCFRKGLGHR